MTQPPDNPISAPAFPWDKAVRQAVHDMRTPLSSMLTTVAVMRQMQAAASLPPQWERLIGMMERQVQDLSGQLSRLNESPASFLKEEQTAE
ncbi:hypothetical protein OKA04_18125 [Luteolibacter flavescens]|uniref:histidine kinase n=1 Tax=Luteolibacter flavescens TaxID=1859460 RepID=A0ABT3FSV5_9BACT|nr:histidine kinase dimerization/phospho-acceptor domain-containing protein [Luteolibacter flavescens]MCW1886662.1 hypothetical protein [Luteolibacter flavescens]